MHYHVACDPNKKSSELTCVPYGQRGIPTAFVVDRKGRVVWLGHPMAGLGKVLQQILDRTYDMQKA